MSAYDESELLLIKSIYDESTLTLDSTFPLHGIFSAKINSHVLIDTADVAELMPTEYLNLKLQFLMPADYPNSDEKAKPQIFIECFWLNTSQIYQLQNKLLELWIEHDRSNILFIWFTFIETELLDFFHIAHAARIKVQPDFKYEIEKFDEATKLKIFNSSIFECDICLMDKVGQGCEKLEKCQHVFCTDCLNEYFSIEIDAGNSTIQCPKSDCDEVIFDHQIQKIVNESKWSKYMKWCQKKKIDEKGTLVYCPRANCQAPVLMNEVDRGFLGQCEACGFNFCCICRRAYHPAGISQCNLLTKADIVQYFGEFDIEDPEDCAALKKKYGAAVLHRIMLLHKEEQSKEYLNENSKRCPKCKSNCELVAGCNRVMCINCECVFCWICLETVRKYEPGSNKHDYSHWVLMGGCSLFSVPDEFW